MCCASLPETVTGQVTPGRQRSRPCELGETSEKSRSGKSHQIGNRKRASSEQSIAGEKPTSRYLSHVPIWITSDLPLITGQYF
jgi:hypothetical protein